MAGLIALCTDSLVVPALRDARNRVTISYNHPEHPTEFTQTISTDLRYTVEKLRCDIAAAIDYPVDKIHLRRSARSPMVVAVGNFASSPCLHIFASPFIMPVYFVHRASACTYGWPSSCLPACFCLRASACMSAYPFITGRPSHPLMVLRQRVRHADQDRGK